MFWTRLLSGIVLLVIALATFSFGNIFLAVPLWLISLIAYRELTKALRCETDENYFYNALFSCRRHETNMCIYRPP